MWSCLIVSGQYAVIAFLALGAHTRAGRVIWGAGSDLALSHGRKPLLLVLTAVGLAGSLLLLATPRNAPTWALVTVAAFAGFGLIGYQGLWVTMVAEAAGPSRVGAATGFAITLLSVSIALSPAAYGAVADAAGSYRAIWAALAIVLALAFIPAALVHEPDR